MVDNEEIKKRFDNDNLEYRHLLPRKRLTLNERKELKEEQEAERLDRRTERHERAVQARKQIMKEYFQREKPKKKHKWRERIRIAAYKRLKMNHKKEYQFYTKMIKKKIYKKYGRVW